MKIEDMDGVEQQHHMSENVFTNSYKKKKHGSFNITLTSQNKVEMIIILSQKYTRAHRLNSNMYTSTSSYLLQLISFFCSCKTVLLLGTFSPFSINFHDSPSISSFVGVVWYNFKYLPIFFKSF